MRERLEGHKESVNSLDILKRAYALHSDDYLGSKSFEGSDIMVSASDDKTMMLWDLRINKRVMLL